MSRSKAEDRKARRIYHLSHCIMRMKHRYGLTMDDADYDLFCETFRRGEAQGAKPDDKGHIEGWIKFKDTWVCMSYVVSLNLIGTIMPAPPPLVFEEVAKKAAKDAAKPKETPEWLKDEQRVNKLVGERAKKMAYTLFDQAMSHGKAPKWLQEQMLTGDGEPVKDRMQRTAEAYVQENQRRRLLSDPDVKRADIAWFKRKMHQSRMLIRDGKILEAAVLLDAAASLAGDFRPSAAPEEAEKLIEARIAQEEVWWSKHFQTKGFPKVLEPTTVTSSASQPT